MTLTIDPNDSVAATLSFFAAAANSLANGAIPISVIVANDQALNALLVQMPNPFGAGTTYAALNRLPNVVKLAADGKLRRTYTALYPVTDGANYSMTVRATNGAQYQDYLISLLGSNVSVDRWGEQNNPGLNYNDAVIANGAAGTVYVVPGLQTLRVHLRSQAPLNASQVWQLAVQTTGGTLLAPAQYPVLWPNDGNVSECLTRNSARRKRWAISARCDSVGVARHRRRATCGLIPPGRSMREMGYDCQLI